MIFAIFLKWSFENHIKGKSVKIQESTSVIIFVILPNKWQFRLENKNFKFLGIQPIYDD